LILQRAHLVDWSLDGRVSGGFATPHFPVADSS
jgi:hypothetical protein